MINSWNKYALAVLCLVFAACEQTLQPLSNAVYFGEAQTSKSKNVTVKEDGAAASVYLSLAAPSETDVEVVLSNDEQVLDAFNKRNGTTYKLLPSNYYSLSSTQCVIEAGKLSSEIVDVNINAFGGDLEAAEKYAIPVKIASATGADILEASDHMVILCDRIINTQVLMTKGGSTVSTTQVTSDTETICNSATWTFEFLTYSTSYLRNSHIFSLNHSEINCPVFGRFAEYDHDLDEIQVKICNIPLYGISRFEPNRWYHVAITCDGSSIRLYQDGVLDLTADSPEPNRTYLWNMLTLRCGNPGALSEVRIWNTVRTQAEIANNMYAVNPRSSGLEVYWKLDDGPGVAKAKDYTENGWDIPMMNGTWQTQSFPPEY